MFTKWTALPQVHMLYYRNMLTIGFTQYVPPDADINPPTQTNTASRLDLDGQPWDGGKFVDPQVIFRDS